MKKIKDMKYTEFVGFINQWNVLPGSFNTLSKWRIFGDITNRSNILEIACTTGFSSRELAVLSGCKGIGIDLSENSITSAQKNKKLYAPEIDIQYEIGNALNFNAQDKFSHIVLGSSLGFFDKPELLLNKIPELLQDGGYVLASPFFVKEKIPKDLVDKAYNVFDITVTQEDYKTVMKLYSDFEIIYESREDLIKETKSELEHYCKSTIDKLKEEGVILNEEDYKDSYDRLMEIKEMSNDLRPYQGYSVLVLRYRKKHYGKRYVELF